MIKIDKIKIDYIEDYASCPAKACMNIDLEKKPVKQVVLDNSRKGLNDVILSSLGKERLDQDSINRAVSLIVSTPGYKDEETDERTNKDISYLVDLFDILQNQLLFYDYELTGAIIPFELSYGGIIVESAIDFTIKDNSRGYIFPAILDFSRTKYENHFNPIVYRCQSVIDHMDIMEKNTEVVVFSPYSNKSKAWIYNKNRFGDAVSTSISEICSCMKNDMFYHRVGWWCAGCSYRGICFRIMKDKRKK